jgi:putative PIG3 family NAD(P)H quinone oxidoreductase
MFMKAVLVDHESNLSWGETDKPTINADEILVKVHATAINRADLMQRKGMYPPPAGASEIMGLECAGEVVELGANVSNWNVGDQVCALLAGGGYAQYVAIPSINAMPIPAGLSMNEAAALPEVFATAWLNLFIEAALVPDEKVILHAGASGVGTAGIQLCKAFGNPCFVTVGNEEKLATCIELGATAGSNRHEGSFLEKATTFAAGTGVDVILDPVGGSYLNDNLQLLAIGGRLVLIGLMGGSKVEMELAMLMMKRTRIIGSTLRARSPLEKAVVLDQLVERVWPKIVSGEIKPIVDTVLPITSVDDAHALVASDKTIGKVILSVDV